MAKTADYHKRPVISARVSRESLDWAHGEANRRGQPFGDFMDGLITAERDRMASRPPALVAASQEQPKTTRKRTDAPAASREPESAGDIMAALRRRNGGKQ